MEFSHVPILLHLLLKLFFRLFKRLLLRKKINRWVKQHRLYNIAYCVSWIRKTASFLLLFPALPHLLAFLCASGLNTVRWRRCQKEIIKPFTGFVQPLQGGVLCLMLWAPSVARTGGHLGHPYCSHWKVATHQCYTSSSDQTPLLWKIE